MSRIRTRITQKSLAARFLACVLHGHRWDVAPGHGRRSELECVRCGLGTDTAHGLT